MFLSIGFLLSAFVLGGALGNQTTSALHKYKLCDQCMLMVDTIYKMSVEVSREKINFYDLPVPCNLVDDIVENFYLCNDIIESVRNVSKPEITTGFNICVKAKYCKTVKIRLEGAHHPTTKKPGPKTTTKKPGPKTTTKHPKSTTKHPEPDYDYVLENKPESQKRDADDNSETKTKLKMYFNKQNSSIDMHPMGDVVCYACTTILKAIIPAVAHVKELEIFSVAKSKCSSLDPTLKDQCIALVQFNKQSLIHLLTQKLPPTFMCQELKQCSFPLCEVCKITVKDIKSNTERSDNEVCSHIPFIYTKVCHRVLKANKPRIAKLAQLVDDASVENKVCPALEFCPAKLRHVPGSNSTVKSY